MEVSYEEDGQAIVKTAVGGPVAKREPLGTTGKGALAAARGHRASGGGGLALHLGGTAGHHLQLLVLLSCFMAALAAVAGTCPSALSAALGLPWLS